MVEQPPYLIYSALHGPETALFDRVIYRTSPIINVRPTLTSENIFDQYKRVVDPFNIAPEDPSFLVKTGRGCPTPRVGIWGLRNPRLRIASLRGEGPVLDENSVLQIDCVRLLLQKDLDAIRQLNVSYLITPNQVTADWNITNYLDDRVNGSLVVNPGSQLSADLVIFAKYLNKTYHRQPTSLFSPSRIIYGFSALRAYLNPSL